MKHLDLNYLKEVSNNDQLFITEMLEMFLKNTCEELTQLEAATDAQQWGEVKMLAHKIKGPVQMLNATAANLVTIIEKDAGLHNKPHEIKENVNILVDLLINKMMPEAKLYLENKEA